MAQAHLNFLFLKWHSTFFKFIIGYGPLLYFFREGAGFIQLRDKEIKLFELKAYKNLFRILQRNNSILLSPRSQIMYLVEVQKNRSLYKNFNPIVQQMAPHVKQSFRDYEETKLALALTTRYFPFSFFLLKI